jgi:two-component system chemotaxis response regulator CheY
MARVLITDDAAFMRMMIRNILSQNGHDVVGEASNGAEAIEQYGALKPDVCTMDITMPEKDGIAALKDILAADPAARVVMCSALGQEAKVIESIRSGAKDFIVKPFQQDRVLSAIEKALT